MLRLFVRGFVNVEDEKMMKTNCLADARYRNVVNDQTQLNNVGVGLVVNKIKLISAEQRIY